MSLVFVFIKNIFTVLNKTIQPCSQSAILGKREYLVADSML